MTNPRFSIIIPCLNEADNVKNLLGDMLAQEYRDFEVLVTDTHSTDNTAAVVKSFQANLSLQLLEETERGVAKARNFAATKAKGEYLVFLDADVRVPAHFLARMDAELARKKWDVGAARFVANSNRLDDRFGTWVTYKYALLLIGTKKPFASGYGLFCRRSLHEKIHGFDETLVLAEDHDYAERAVAAGGEFGYVKSTYVRVSMRRWDDEGRLKLAAKYLYAEVYRLVMGKIQKPLFEYKFGKFAKDGKKKG